MARKIDPAPRLKTERPGTRRGEDEGGQMIEGNDASSPDQAFVQPAPTPSRKRVTSLRWNERFVIQPFQPGNGMMLGSGKHAKQTARKTGLDKEKTL